MWLTAQEAADLQRRINDLLPPLGEKLKAEREGLDPEAAEDSHEGRVHYTVDLSWFPDFGENPMRGSIWSSGIPGADLGED